MNGNRHDNMGHRRISKKAIGWIVTLFAGPVLIAIWIQSYHEEGITWLVRFVSLLLGGAIMYSPGLFLKNSKKLTTKELIGGHPGFAWMRWGYPILVALWVLCAFVLYGFAANPLGCGIHLIGAVFASVAVFNGLFAVLTGVCPVYSRSNYFYVYEERMRAVGFQLIALGTATIVIGFLVVRLLRL